MRVATFFVALLQFLMGAWCISHPGSNFLALAFPLGMVMILSGFMHLLHYLKGNRDIEEEDRSLSECLLGILLGIIVMCNLLLNDAMLLLFFGMWVLFSGILRIVAAVRLRRKKRAHWYAKMIAGLVDVATGFYAFLNPLVGGMALAVLVGFCFVLQGVNTVLIGAWMPARGASGAAEPKAKEVSEEELFGQERLLWSETHGSER